MTVQNVSSNPMVQQIGVQELSQQMQALARALIESGVPPAQVGELVANHISGQCNVCGIRVAGEELRHLVEASAGAEALAKVKRLSLGDCARKDCDSKFYQLNFQPCATVDWAKVWNLSLNQKGVDAIGQKPAIPNQNVIQFLQEHLGRRNLIALGLGLFVLLVWLYFQFRTPSWSKHPSGYQVEKSSIELRVDQDSVRR